MPAVDLKVTVGLKWSATVPQPPAGVSVDFRTQFAWTGIYRVAYNAFSQDFPVLNGGVDDNKLITTQIIPIGTNVTVTMLTSLLAILCINPAQSFTVNDGAFGAGWSNVNTLTCGLGYVYSQTNTLTADFPPATWTANTLP